MATVYHSASLAAQLFIILVVQRGGSCCCTATKCCILQVLCCFHLSHRTIGIYKLYLCYNKEDRECILVEAGANMNRSVLMVLCLVTLSNVQLGQSQCDGEV